MKTNVVAASCFVALATLPIAAPGDNPALHLRDQAEMLFDPAEEARIEIVLKQEEVPYRRNNKLPGTPIFEISLLPSQANERVLTAVGRLPFLRSVSTVVVREKLSPQQVVRIAKLRQIERLALETSELGPAEMKALAAMPRLRELYLMMCDSVTESGLKEIASSAQLQSLELDGCRGVTDSGVKELSRLKCLKYLGLGQTGITDAALTDLARMPNLLVLDLEDTTVTDAGLDELATMPSLHSLDLSRTGITTTGLQKLARSKSLARLTLMRTKVSDEGLEALGHLPTLQRINVLYCDLITGEGVRRLKAALPDCKVSYDPEFLKK
jgi:hypothetical protein